MPSVFFRRVGDRLGRQSASRWMITAIFALDSLALLVDSPLPLPVLLLLKKADTAVLEAGIAIALRAFVRP